MVLLWVFFFCLYQSRLSGIKTMCFCFFSVVTVAFASIRRGEASHRCSSAPQQSNNPWEDLFSGIMLLAVMLPGTSVTIIPTKSNVWGCVCVCACYCLSQGIICYYCGYYGFHSISSHMYCCVRGFLHKQATQRKGRKQNQKLNPANSV